MRPIESPGPRRQRVDALRPQLENILLAATEAAALAAARFIGRGDEERAKQAAAGAMLETLDGQLDVAGRIALTPGGDEILSPGSVVGRGEEAMLDLAVYPVEAGGMLARGMPNSCSIAIAALSDTFPVLPPVAYVEKFSVGPAARGGIDLEDTLVDNLRRLAFAKDCRVADLVVAVLDRPRHQDLMEEIRSTGARVLVLGDGDVGASMLPAVEDAGVDAMIGVGGVQEAVMAACAIKSLSGDIQVRLWPRNEEEVVLAGSDAGRVYRVGDLVPAEIVMAVTGITGGPLLRPVRFRGAWSDTDSMVMASRYSTSRRVTTRHHRTLPE